MTDIVPGGGAAADHQVGGTGPHPDLPVLGPVTGSWSRYLSDDTWYWSDEMYVIHGFAPGQVLPSTELVLRHKHPEDLERSQRLVQTAAELGTPFSNYHRIIDARGRVRQVLTVGRGFTDADGELVEVTGYTVDLTATWQAEVQPAIEEALGNAMEHRGSIEQAKGGLMVALGLSADDAFELLRETSNRENIKLHELARRVVEEVTRIRPSPGSEAVTRDMLARAAMRSRPSG